MLKKVLFSPIRGESPETASLSRHVPLFKQRRHASADPHASFHTSHFTASDLDSHTQTCHGRSIFETIIVERHEADLPRRLSKRCVLLACLLIAVGGLWGCEKVNSVFHRSTLPDMGPRLANSVKLTFDPSFTNLKMQYIDGCNSPHELNVGEEVESLMIHAASQNFTAVTVIGGVPAQFKPDTEIVITLQRSGLKLWADNVYDRVPADLTIETLVTLKDAAGKELGRQTVSIVHNQRLILEPAIRRCEYGNIDGFVHDAGIALSTHFIRAVRTQLAATGGTVPTPVATSPVKPVPTAAVIPSQSRPRPWHFIGTFV